MAKKDKKAKRQQKAKIIQQSLAVAAESTIEPTVGNEEFAATEAEKTILPKGKEKNQPVKKDNFLHDNSQVKKEAKKIAIIFGSIIIVLIALKVLDNRMDLTLKLADILSKHFK